MNSNSTKNSEKIEIKSDAIDKRSSNIIKHPEKRKSKNVNFSEIKENQKENLDAKNEIVYKMKINFKKKNQFRQKILLKK